MIPGFKAAYDIFIKSGIANPLEEMFAMLDILALEKYVLPETSPELVRIIEKRQEGMPWEYILGRTNFMGLSFTCTPDALIPRAETELLVQTVLAFLKEKEIENPIVIDMGTGSGNIAVSVAYHAPNVRVFASDISPNAVKLAQDHVDKYALQDRVSLFSGDLFTPLASLDLENSADVIVCNPPYIPTGSLDKLAPEIIEHEPTVALDAGPYGINIYRRLIEDSLKFLKPGGVLAFEIGAGQDKIATRLLNKSGGYSEITPVPDEKGVTRVITAVR